MGQKYFALGCFLLLPCLFEVVKPGNCYLWNRMCSVVVLSFSWKNKKVARMLRNEELFMFGIPNFLFPSSHFRRLGFQAI